MSGFRASFGPGLLWAAAAIGVSHLVQSTRAGADAGFGLAGVVIIALVVKYPFFEYGPRYAAATRSSLVEGYRRIGRWALWLYLAITVVTSVIIDAAVIIFTSFLLAAVLGLSWPVALVAALVYAGGAALLVVGRYRLLDASIKFILVALALCTVIAALFAAPRADLSTLALLPEVGPPPLVSLAFILALVGWMPTAFDLAVWSSLWTLAKDGASGVRTSVETARADFLVGYVGTGILAFAFLVLGATIMYGTGRGFSPQGAVFSLQLVDLYAQTLGAWSRPFILVAVLTTMVSTSMVVIDGFPRAIARSVEVLRGHRPGDEIETGPAGRIYWSAMAAIGVLTVLVLSIFAGSLTRMVDFATIVSFLTAPILGYLNLRAVTGPEMPSEHRPGRALRAFSWFALLLLTGFGLLYLGWLLGR